MAPPYYPSSSSGAIVNKSEAAVRITQMVCVTVTAVVMGRAILNYAKSL